MWLFIPATAYWTGSSPAPRAWNSGRHAGGTVRRAASASYAANHRLAKRTSSSVIVTGSRNVVASTGDRR